MLTFKQYALLGLSCLSFISCSSSTESEVALEAIECPDAPVEQIAQAKERVNGSAVSHAAVSGQKAAASVAGADAVLPAVAPQVNQPAQPFKPQSPGISVSRVSVPDKLVALTFDDGPHPTLTPRLLDILARTGAKATFFTLGQNVTRYPDIVRRAEAEGNEIANHSYSHPNLNKCSLAKIYQELDATDTAIQKATGKRPSLVRPPYGNMKKDVRAQVNRKYGYHVVLWDVDPLDWRKPGSGVVAQRMVKGARPGSILLAHDIHEGTINAMESMIKSLQAQGYRFVTVSQLIAAGQSSARQASVPPASSGEMPQGVTPEAVLPATAFNE